MLRQPTFVGRFLPENDVVTYEAEMEALDRLEENKMETEPSLQDRFERFDGDMRGDDLTSRGTTTLTREKNLRLEGCREDMSLSSGTRPLFPPKGAVNRPPLDPDFRARPAGAEAIIR